MRTVHATGFAAVLAATALVAPGAASAASPVGYSGQFDEFHAVQYVGCTTASPTADYASGEWSIKLQGTSAKATFAMELNGEPHVAYTYAGMKQAPGGVEGNWVAYGKTGAGLLTLTVTGLTMEYKIAPYNYNGLSCQYAIFPATVRN